MAEMLRVELGEYVVFKAPEGPVCVTAYGKPIEVGECGDLIYSLAGVMLTAESKIAQALHALNDF